MKYLLLILFLTGCTIHEDAASLRSLKGSCKRLADYIEEIKPKVLPKNMAELKKQCDEQGW